MSAEFQTETPNMNHTEIHKNISGLLEHFGFTEQDVTISFDEKSNTIWFSITSPHTRLLFARDAEALSALNHLSSRIVEQLSKEDTAYPRIVIDANNFEKKKIESLRTVAHMMAERARYFKSSVELEPMSPRDRKIVHEFLQDIPDVYTESQGDGPKRHIVIRFKESEKI